MVTQSGREAECKSSIENFSRQSFSNKELIVIHDGPDEFHQHLCTVISNYPKSQIQVFSSPKQSLGLLRNQSVKLANYPYICQWDDDDLSHPDRLALQFEFLQQMNAEFCFLTDQLHLFSEQRVLFWDDWSVERYPGNLIQGTMLGRRDLVGEYADLSTGEDTDLVSRIIAQGNTIAPMSGFGWMYLYIYNGRNAWSLEHHKAISNWKRLKYNTLKSKQSLLEQKLLDYGLAYDSLSMLHERGKFEIQL
jgi:glycosyltransferase involved in cell wall biosynthesis